MNYEYYWLLDTAIRCQIPFNWLSASNLGEMLNRETHNLSNAALLETLVLMFEQGDLYLNLHNRDGTKVSLTSPPRPFVEETLYASHDEWVSSQQRVYYGVTLQGATKWEQLSAPRWEKLFEEGYEMGPYQGEIIAAERATVETLLSLTHYDDWIQTVISESVTWTTLQPWSATYWKALPIGHQVRFTYIPYTETDQTVHTETPPWVRSWRDDMSNWYTNYIGLPCSL